MTCKSHRQPLYGQLVDILIEKIDHEYQPGDLIPSERELAERYGLSRSTVRLAIQELEHLGRIVRKQGRGTYVADRLAQATNLTQSYSFTEQMKAMGRLPETTILEFCEMEADKTLSIQMGIRLGERVLKLKRLRLADGIPMMVERSYLPARLFISLKRPLLEQKPLYDVIEQDYQQKIRVADEEFSAGIARPCDARLLGIDEGSPVLDIVRTTHNTQNDVVEFTLSVARADKFKYRISHYRDAV